MRNGKIFSSIISLVLVLSAHAIDFSRINIAWKYDPQAEIEMKDRIVQNGEEMTIFLRIRADSLMSWNFDFLIQPRYESESHVKLEQYRIDTLFSESNAEIVKLTFKKPEENLLVVKIFKENFFYYHDIPLKNGSLSHPSIYPVTNEGLPIFDNYLNKSGFKWEGTDNPYVQQYLEDFPFADPPMGEMKPLAPSILPDTAFVFSHDSSFLNSYFYVVREDATTSAGVTVLRTSPYYPEFKQLNELATAMQYILNEPERKEIRNSRDLKQSFDSFWIKTYVTKFRARNAIRNYFNWVKQANRLFTDFKQGWKTDRGMLFIVYGAPDEVYRTDTEEEWFYDNGPSFEFTVISTFFSPKTYALRRQVEFEENWFEYIGAIRRGSNE